MEDVNNSVVFNKESITIIFIMVILEKTFEIRVSMYAPLKKVLDSLILSIKSETFTYDFENVLCVEYDSQKALPMDIPLESFGFHDGVKILVF